MRQYKTRKVKKKKVITSILQFLFTGAICTGLLTGPAYTDAHAQCLTGQCNPLSRENYIKRMTREIQHMQKMGIPTPVTPISPDFRKKISTEAENTAVSKKHTNVKAKRHFQRKKLTSSEKNEKTTGSKEIAKTSTFKKLKRWPPAEVHPGKTTVLYFSNIDLNRIVCVSGDIDYVRYYDTRNIIQEIKGNNLYIGYKMTYDPSTGEVHRVKIPVTLYISCNGEIYSIIAYPREIAGRTVFLVSARNVRKKITDEITRIFQRYDFTQFIVDTLQRVFKDDIPPYWERSSKYLNVPYEKKAVITLKKGKTKKVKVIVTEVASWKIPSLPVVIRELTLTLKTPYVVYPVDETFLLDPAITVNPVAISIENLSLEPDKPVKAVIIEKEIKNKRGE